MEEPFRSERLGATRNIPSLTGKSVSCRPAFFDCDACGVKEMYTYNLHEHYSGQKHSQEISSRKFAECKICKITFKSSAFRRHLKSWNHIENAKKLSQSRTHAVFFEKMLVTMKQFPPKDWQENSSLSPGYKPFRGPGFSRPSSSFEEYCALCDVRCSGPEPYRQHMLGNKHKRNCQMKQTLTDVSPLESGKEGANDYSSASPSSTEGYRQLNTEEELSKLKPSFSTCNATSRICSFCGIFSLEFSTSTLNRHVFTEHQDYLFQCQQCAFDTLSVGNILEHVNLLHPGVLNAAVKLPVSFNYLECPECQPVVRKTNILSVLLILRNEITCTFFTRFDFLGSGQTLLYRT